MKVLGISSSPRRGGNTEFLLDKALQGARGTGTETEKIVLNELNFSPCQECGGCQQTGICVVQDDMQEVYRKMAAARVIIIASPIFFGSITAQLKMMFDRYQCYWVRKYVLKRTAEHNEKRLGFFICVGGLDRQDFFHNAEALVKVFFHNLDTTYTGALFYSGITERGEIALHPTAMREALEHGKSLAAENNLTHKGRYG